MRVGRGRRRQASPERARGSPGRLARSHRFRIRVWDGDGHLANPGADPFPRDAGDDGAARAARRARGVARGYGSGHARAAPGIRAVTGRHGRVPAGAAH